MAYGSYGPGPDLEELLELEAEMVEDSTVLSSGIGTTEPGTMNGSTVPGTEREPADQRKPRRGAASVPAPTVRTGRELATVPGSVPPMREPGTEPEPILYADVASMLDGTLPEPPAPTILRRMDGHALFYDGQVNLVFGDPEGGKTWVCLAAVTEQLNTGHKAIVIDLDHNGPAAIVSRLLALGASVSALRDPGRFRYTEPEDRLELLMVIEDMKAWRPAVAVVDSIGELLPLFGTSSNSADDFTSVHTRVLKPLAKSGAAVLAVDHLAKGQDSRAQGPGGTAAKKRAIGGVSLRVKVKDSFTPGKGGSAYLSVNKDRHGGLRAHCPTGDREPLAGLFKLTVWHGEGTDDVLQWEVTAPMDGERNPDESVPPGDIAAMAALDPEPSTVDDAQARLKWNRQRTAKALKAFREEKGQKPA